MKQTFTLIVAMLLALPTFAYDKATAGNEYYGSSCKAYGLADGTVAIYQYYTQDGQTEVTFPATIDVYDGETLSEQYEVSQVGYDTWGACWIGTGSTNGMTTLTSITLSEGIKTINASAFYGATALTTVNLPSTLTTIGDYSFSGCDALTTVNSGANAMTVGVDAFKGTSSWDAIAKNCVFNVPDGAWKGYAAYSADDTQTWTYLDQFYNEGNLHETSTIEVGAAGYATYYNDYGYVLPEGLEAYVLAQNEDGTQTLTKQYEAGNSVAPKMALLIKAAAASSEAQTFVVSANVNTTVNTTTWPDNLQNMLGGVQAESTITSWDSSDYSYYYYKLADGDNGFGWYWGAEDGGVFTLAAHNAFLAKEKTMPAVKYLAMDGTTTGIGQALAEKSVKAEAVFNLAGQRVGNDYKGVVIVKGKKIVRK